MFLPQWNRVAIIFATPAAREKWNGLFALPINLMSAPKEIIVRLNKLKEAIEKYRYEYHVLDKSTISPEALDSLKRELVEIETKYPELATTDSPSQRVAGKPLPEFEKVAHKVSQWSFNDAFTEENQLLPI